MLGVRTLGISENRVEDLRCTVEFPWARGGVDKIEGGQSAEESVVPIQVADEPRDAMMGWVAVDKSWQCRSRCVSVSGGNEEGKSVLEKAVQARIQALRPVGLPWEKAGGDVQLFVEKLEFFRLRFEVLKIGMGKNEVENQQPLPNEVGGVEAMIPKVLPANQIVNLAGGELEDVSLVAVLGRLGMMLREQFSGKPMDKTALGLAGEREELVACEVSRMGSGQVKKTSFLLVVTRVSQPVEVILMWIEGGFGVHAVASSIHLIAWIRPAIDIYVFGA